MPDRAGRLRLLELFPDRYEHVGRDDDGLELHRSDHLDGYWVVEWGSRVYVVFDGRCHLDRWCELDGRCLHHWR